MSAPGWYPDPNEPRQLRYWDGGTWTEHIQTGGLPPSVAARTMDASTAVATREEVVWLTEEIARLRAEYDTLRRDLIETSDLMLLQEIGIYEYAHPLADAVAYRDRLQELQSELRDAARSGRAVIGTNKWAVNGSEKDGAKMVADFKKLMLRTYNNEADNIVRTLKPYALASAVARLEKTRTTIKKLGSIMKIEITDNYHRMRVEELELTADFAVTVAEEKEREREERARLKEEEAVRREYEREQARLEKEKTHYETVIAALREKGDARAIEQAEVSLAEIARALDGVIERAANTRAGYVYIISNIGAFGERMVKIGLTRRLDPLDRVRELGDASVPFRFDVHAIVFSDDAVGLETSLHQRFADERVNLVNARREFFYATPEEVRDALVSSKGDLLSFASAPEALEWHQSQNLRRGRR